MEERRLRVFENRVLRRIFGAMRDEIPGGGGGRKLHNEALNDLYSSPNTIWVTKLRRIRWVGHVARMGQRRGAYKVLVGKPKGKRPLVRPSADARIILRWIFVTLVNGVMNLRVP